MPDIELRFHKDMLVLSAPIAAALARQGVDVERDLEFFNILEPDSIRDALRMELVAGAQCLVTATEGITPARLAHHGMADRVGDLAAASLDVAESLTPQHLVVEVGPCRLPLDASSKASLNEHRDQYARAARAFEAHAAGQGSAREGSIGRYGFDAYLLSGFGDASALKCALMGVRQVSDRPVISCVDVDERGVLASGRSQVEEAAEMMVEYGASVAGFTVSCPVDAAVPIAQRMARACGLPLCAELRVPAHDPAARGRLGVDPKPYETPDELAVAALRLRAAGVQFLRAVGQAAPAYTGVLVAATAGHDVVCRETAASASAHGEDRCGS